MNSTCVRVSVCQCTRGMFLDTVERVGLDKLLRENKHWSLDKDDPVITNFQLPLREREHTQTTNTHSLYRKNSDKHS